MSFRLPLKRALCATLFAALLMACDMPSGATSAEPTSTRQAQTPRPDAHGAAKAAGTSRRDPVSGLAFVAVRDLPPEGQHTLRLIRAGGPFPYRKDGATFGNREGLLAKRPRGGYREYTVPTPGEGDRGARRIVCAAMTPPDRECYYTADHYSSFRRIAP